MPSLCRIFSPESLRRLSRDSSGATQVEYSLIVALVSVAVLSGASEVGSMVKAVFSKSSQSIEQTANAAAANCGPGNGNGNCANKGNGGGNTNGSGSGTGNGGQNNGQGGNSGNGGGGKGAGND
jgi:Flp pilus assembly pilin Flp